MYTITIIAHVYSMILDPIVSALLFTASRDPLKSCQIRHRYLTLRELAHLTLPVLTLRDPILSLLLAPAP